MACVRAAGRASQSWRSRERSPHHRRAWWAALLRAGPALSRSGARPCGGSGPVRAGQVLGAAHLDQARGGALEGAGQALALVQRRRLGGGGADQVDVAVVELVDE